MASPLSRDLIAHPTPTDSDEEKINVLLVDDRRENLLALESVLEPLGQNLVLAQSGRDALKHLLHEDFAVVLLDVQMPEIDGFETAVLIRQRDRTRHTPIIFLTAINKSDVHVARGYSLGAVDYVFKPFDPDVLRSKVSAFVELSKKESALRREIAQRRQAEERLDASNAVLATISDGLVSFISEGDPRGVFGRLLAGMLSLSEAEQGFIGEVLYTADGEPTVKSYALTPSDGRGKERRSPTLLDALNLGAVCAALNSASLLALNTPAEIPWNRMHRVSTQSVHNLLALPLRKGDSLVGMAIIANRSDDFDSEIAEALTPFQNACSIVIDALHNEQARRQAEDEVRRLNLELERRVADRTAKLREANRELENEIQERRRAEEDRERLFAAEQAARQEAEANLSRLRFLGEASAILSASREYATALEQVARRAVEDFADFCTIHLVEAGSLRRIALAHTERDREALLRDLDGMWPSECRTQEVAQRVLESGRPELSSDVVAPVSEGDGQGDPFVMIAELGVNSHMAAPLLAMGEPIGVISFGSSQSGRRYGAEDLIMAEDLAARAVAAIENARLFEEIQLAARRKDEFLAMLAHELRNPLAAMSNAEYALDRLDAPNERVTRLRSILRRQTQNLSRLVDDLLDISRITRGKIVLKKDPITIESVVERAVEAAGPLVTQRNHHLSVSLPPMPVWIDADSTRVEQIVSNLISNAAKYTEPGGHIELEVESAASEVIIVVRDNGIGIPRDLMPCIFDLFTQSQRSLDRSQGGLGIGLALVKNLVQMHGGAVACRSEGPGKGSEFEVRLPTVPAPEFAPVSEMTVQTEEVEEPAATQKVMLVEDNRDAAETLADLLDLWGHRVEIAMNGPSAIEEFRRNRPDVVILDIGLPGMDGYEVARALRDEPEGKSIPLVALTGYGQDEDRRRAVEAGFDYHLTKPVDPIELQAILQQAGAA